MKNLMKNAVVLWYTASIFNAYSLYGRAIKVPNHIEYLNNFYGHIYSQPSKDSETLTVVACGHPIRVFNQWPLKKGQDIFVYERWHSVKQGMHKGFIKKSDLKKKRPMCFQDLYPKFVESFKLSVSDRYYWGKLHGQFIKDRSRVK